MTKYEHIQTKHSYYLIPILHNKNVGWFFTSLVYIGNSLIVKPLRSFLFGI